MISKLGCVYYNRLARNRQAMYVGFKRALSMALTVHCTVSYYVLCHGMEYIAICMLGRVLPSTFKLVRYQCCLLL